MVIIFLCLFLKSVVEKDLDCFDCVIVHRILYQRRTNKIDHPGQIHCTDSSKLRSLEDIVMATGNSANRPWKLLGMTYSDFENTIAREIPHMHVSFMSLASFDSGKALQKRKDVDNFDKRIKDKVHYDGDFPLNMPEKNWNIPSKYGDFTDSAHVSKKYIANKFIHYAM